MAQHHKHYENAMALRSRILSGQTNETPVMAWAAVCRECANADRALRASLDGQPCGRLELNFLNNLGAIWWFAKAQREYHANMNMAKVAA